MPALERTLPAWWLIEQIEASDTVPADELAADRRDFLRFWGEVTGGGILCGRREVGVRGLPTGEAVGRPVWLHVGPDGSTRPLADETGLPPPSSPEPVLISPIPAYTAEPERQWRGAHLWNRWPFVTIDIDRKDVEAAGTTIDAVLDRIRPLPTLVVRSGGELGGAHVWIALSEFLPLERALEWNRRLADLHCGDPMQARSRPSLRLPGTCNVKWHLDLEIPPRLCLIDRTRTDYKRRYKEAELSCQVAIPHRFRLPARPPAIDVTDCPPWIAALLRAAGCEEWEVARRYLRGQERTVVIPLVCPVCGNKGTAWIYADEDEPRLGCHRRSCPGWPSLRTAAAGLGIEIDPDGDDKPFHDAYRPAALEAALTPPASVVYAPGARADEQAEITQAANAAWTHAQTADPKRILWVVESSTGIGKDYAVTRALEATVGAGRWDIYGKSQKHLHDKAQEWPAADRKLRLHVSPLSLVGPNGERCQKRGLMGANVHKGWEAARVCLTAGPRRPAAEGGGREPCEFFEECAVRDGVRELGGAREPLVDLYTTRRLEAVGPVEHDRPAWIDESFRLVYSQSVTSEELRRFSLAHDVSQEYRHLACALLATCDHLPVHGTLPIEPAPGSWDPSLRNTPKPELPSRTTRPDGERPSYPKWVYEVCRAAWYCARADERHGVLWFTRGDSPGSGTWTLWRRTLDRLPKAAIWTNATFWLWADIAAGTPDLEIRRVGHRIEPRYLRRLHLPYAVATRGSDDRPRLLIRNEAGEQVANVDHMQVIVDACSAARKAWADTTGKDPKEARVLVATYKAITERGFGSGAADFLEKTGATAVDYYERLVGTNEFAGWECIVLLGTPYPRVAEEDAAVCRLYGVNTATIADRVSQDTIEQTIGRLRAVSASECQVAVAVTARAPLGWSDATETLIDPRRVWVDLALALTKWSFRICRMILDSSEEAIDAALSLQGLREIQQPVLKSLIEGVRCDRTSQVTAKFCNEIAHIAGMKQLRKKVNGPKTFVKVDVDLSEAIQLLEIAFWDSKERRKAVPDKRLECMWNELRSTDASNMRSVLDKWVSIATHKPTPEA